MTEGQCQKHSGVAEAIKNLQQSDTDQWEHINRIEAALPKLIPVWVTVVLMVMSAVTASALTFAGMWMKFSGKG